jgi:hypothetical protein
MGLDKAGALRGIHGMAIPNTLNAAQAHLGGNPFGAASFLAPCCVTAEGQGRSAELRPKPYGHWRLAFAKKCLLRRAFCFMRHSLRPCSGGNNNLLLLRA